MRGAILLFAAFLAPLATFGCNRPESINDVKKASESALEISLTPRMESGTVKSVDIVLKIPAPQAPAGAPFLSMAIARAMVPGALADPAGLSAEDENGVFPLSIEEDPVDPTAFRQDRRWLPARASAGDVVIRYSATPRVITPETRPGPLYDTRTEDAGFYGSGNTMLALPTDGWPRRVRISWDLSEMPSGARAATSLGEGTVEAELTEQNVSSAFFMAGPLHSQPNDGSGDFVVYWLTPPAFDLEGAAQWTERAYRYFVSFFGREGAPFRIFMRTTKRFQGGGSGGFNSFIFGTVAGEDRDEDELKSLLVHEALHSFTGGYGTGGGGAGQQWYSEGSTSYYTAILPYRAGLSRLDQVAKAFNRLALNYYTNPRSDLSNEDVTKLFFSDSNAQVVPYQRGPLYFALVDARMREASGGKRRVDELILNFIKGRDGADDPVAYWRELVADALGERGAKEFDGMMAGERLDLPSDLLGPCFRAEQRELTRFSLGFRPYKDDAGGMHAGRVAPGSPAEKAGLREGDEILNPQTPDSAEKAGEGAVMTLEILRDGKTTQIAFTPWTAPAPGQQWIRSTAPDDDCNI